MTMRTVLVIAALLTAAPALAVDVLVAGKTFVAKPASVAKFVARGIFPLPAPGSAEDPTQGGALRTIGDNANVGAIHVVLGRFGWKGLRKPTGSKGYRYVPRGVAAFERDPCRVSRCDRHAHATAPRGRDRRDRVPERRPDPKILRGPAAPCDASCNGFACPGGGVCIFDPGTNACGCAP